MGTEATPGQADIDQRWQLETVIARMDEIQELEPAAAVASDSSLSKAIERSSTRVPWRQRFTYVAHMGMCGQVDFVLRVREDGEPGVGTRGRICLTWVKKIKRGTCRQEKHA